MSDKVKVTADHLEVLRAELKRLEGESADAHMEAIKAVDLKDRLDDGVKDATGRLERVIGLWRHGQTIDDVTASYIEEIRKKTLAKEIA